MKHLKAKKVIPPEAQGNDSSGCPHMEGLMKKKNSQGIWKDRYGILKNNFFITYKPKGSKPTSEIKEIIDLKEVHNLSIIDDYIDIRVKSNALVPMLFKTEYLDPWFDAIDTRIEWANSLSEEMDQSPAQPQSSSQTPLPTMKPQINQTLSSATTLKKLNSHGVWKDRYCVFENHIFKAFKTKNGKATSELKETVDFREVESINQPTDLSIEIELDSGNSYQYKALSVESMDRWIQLFREHQDWVKDHLDEIPSSTSNQVALAGTLLKKSHNKYHGFQERYVKIEEKKLKYYKKKNDDKLLGEASLVTAGFVRPFDDSPSCTEFEVQDDNRVFLFQAGSHKEMLKWVRTIDAIIQEIKTQMKEDEIQRLVQETPLRIRQFDALSEIQFSKWIDEELNEHYPAEEVENLAIKDHVACANALLQYLKDAIPEFQRTQNRPARYDVLACVMSRVNACLTQRFTSFLSSSPPERKSAGSLDAEGASEGRPSNLSTSERNDLLESANLGDLHLLIDWLSKYQLFLKSVKCPVALNNNMAKDNNAMKLSKTIKNPRHCELFEQIPRICKLYVYGGSAGSKGGAAAHLYDHCIKVWQSVISKPEEMLQQQQDGRFFTHAPITMWEAINQHIMLATATQSPILHVMIADKIVTTLNDVFHRIIDYINTLNTENQPELQEIELEYISGLANDTALHIEEVIDLIENFAMDEIREKIDEIFDPLTTTLSNCGFACLKRLSRIVMGDVQDLLDQVLLPEWIEGNQIHIAIATISDYMNDLESYLSPFWGEKFVHIVLEDVILGYCRSIIFKKEGASGAVAAALMAAETLSSPAASTSSSGKKTGGFFSSFFKKSNETSATSATSTASAKSPFSSLGKQAAPCLVDDEAIGRISQDVNALNGFFVTKVGEATAIEYLEIMNEISLMLYSDVQSLVLHVANRIDQFPSAAQAIKETALAVMRVRGLDKSSVEMFLAQVTPVVESAMQSLNRNENSSCHENGGDEANAPMKVEGKLSLFYIDLIPKELMSDFARQKPTLAQKLKILSGIPLFNIEKKPIAVAHQDSMEDELLDQEGSDNEEEDGGVPRSGSKDLLDSVIGVLQHQDEMDAALELEEDMEQIKEEITRNEIGALTYESYLEKKSPAHNLWQRRFFKLSTRATMDPDKPFLYHFNWYKKKGSAVIKSLSVDNIKSIAILHSPRPLGFIPHKNTLVLQSEIKGQAGTAVNVQCQEHDEVPTPKLPHLAHLGQFGQLGQLGQLTNQEFFEFRIVTQQIDNENKDLILRTSKVDRLIQWTNLLALACSLSYDSIEKAWNRSAFYQYKEEEKFMESMPSFMTANPTPFTQGLGSEREASTGVDKDASTHNNDDESIALGDLDAASLILHTRKSLKGEKVILEPDYVSTESKLLVEKEPCNDDNRKEAGDLHGGIGSYQESYENYIHENIQESSEGEDGDTKLGSILEASEDVADQGSDRSISDRPSLENDIPLQRQVTSDNFDEYNSTSIRHSDESLSNAYYSKPSAEESPQRLQDDDPQNKMLVNRAGRNESSLLESLQTNLQIQEEGPVGVDCLGEKQGTLSSSQDQNSPEDTNSSNQSQSLPLLADPSPPQEKILVTSSPNPILSRKKTFENPLHKAKSPSSEASSVQQQQASALANESTDQGLIEKDFRYPVASAIPLSSSSSVPSEAGKEPVPPKFVKRTIKRRRPPPPPPKSP